jgi:hypothetical protein
MLQRVGKFPEGRQMFIQNTLLIMSLEDKKQQECNLQKNINR